MEEELHPIELDVGNVARVNANEPAVLPEANVENGPTATAVFQRIEEFEVILRDEWNEFKNSLRTELDDMNRAVGDIEDVVSQLTKLDETEFEVGDSVALLEERKVGMVKKVTQQHVDVECDDQRFVTPASFRKTVRKKKTDLMRLHKN